MRVVVSISVVFLFAIAAQGKPSQADAKSASAVVELHLEENAGQGNEVLLKSKSIAPVDLQLIKEKQSDVKWT